MFIIFVSVVVLLIILHYTSDKRKYWLYRKVPYREPCPIFGNFGSTYTMRRSYTKMLQFFYDNYKHERFIGIFQARRTALLILDLDLAKNIMSTEFSNFVDRASVMTDTKREPLLRNLANMSGAEWKSMRQIVTPTFSSAKMKAMFPLIADCAKQLSDTLKEDALADIDVVSLCGRYTVDVIGSCAFGIDPGSLKNPESPFFIVTKKMFKSDLPTILKRYCRSYFPRLFKLLNLRSYSPAIENFFTSIISQVLEERRMSGKSRKDFLQLMLDTQKTEKNFRITDELITSNSFIFMLAGMETSATTMSFCLYELAKQKEMQESIREEIVKCLRRYGGLNYEAVSAMQLATHAALETLRLHPPTPLTTRMCTTECKLNGTDLDVKPRETVVIPISCIQRDSELFPEPDKFDPERFNQDSSYPQGFLAFGDGPRGCPGSRFALLTVVAGLATIFTRFSVEPCAQTTPQIHYDPRSFLLKNKGGIWLLFRPLEEDLFNLITKNEL